MASDDPLRSSPYNPNPGVYTYTRPGEGWDRYVGFDRDAYNEAMAARARLAQSAAQKAATASTRGFYGETPSRAFDKLLETDKFNVGIVNNYLNNLRREQLDREERERASRAATRIPSLPQQGSVGEGQTAGSGPAPGSAAALEALFKGTNPNRYATSPADYNLGLTTFRDYQRGLMDPRRLMATPYLPDDRRAVYPGQQFFTMPPSYSPRTPTLPGVKVPSDWEWERGD